MASNDNSRGKLLTTGGILSIVAGIFQISSVVLIAVKALIFGWSYGASGLWQLAARWFLPFFPDVWRREIMMLLFPSYLTWVVGFVGVLSILAIVGGISAIRRKRFGLSLAGAICALPSFILGILAVIFIALGKREFGEERKKMASNDNSKGKLLAAGGVLSIVAGIFQVIGLVSITVNLFVPNSFNYRLAESFSLPFFAEAWRNSILLIGLSIIPEIYEFFGPFVMLIGFIGVLGIVAIVGGISAIRKKRFGLSLAGAICALPSFIWGILAVTFISLSKREFTK